MKAYRVLGILAVALLVVISVTECERSNARKVREDTELKEQIKAELKAEMEAERDIDQNSSVNHGSSKEYEDAERLAAYRAKIEADIRADEREKVIAEERQFQTSRNFVPNQQEVRTDQSSLRHMLMQEYGSLKAGLGKDQNTDVAYLNRMAMIQTQLARLEIAEKGGPTAAVDFDSNEQLHQMARKQKQEMEDIKSEADRWHREMQSELDRQRSEMESKMDDQRRKY